MSLAQLTGFALAEQGPYTRLAVEILRLVEARVIGHEERFGRNHLLEVVDRIDPMAFDDHTTYYRKVIRLNTWPNVALSNADLRTFLLGYGRSALAYVDVGFAALRYVASPSTDSFAAIHDLVLASEALRGQFGKSSPDGLDARLEQQEDILLGELRDELLLVLLCTPCEPLQSADSAILDDSIAIQAYFRAAPTLQEFTASPYRADESTWKFLRRHSRWSVRQVLKLLGQLQGYEERAREAREERRLQTAARAAVLAELPAGSREVVDGIVALNYLNLTLEPSFGFKGCVGLPHGLVFQEAERLGRSNAPVCADVSRDKWRLFNDTRLEGI